MKIKSVLKAIASGLIWGLGQLFNRQYWKALFFGVFFIAMIALELGTSKYFQQTSAYDKLPGNDYGDSWYEERFLKGTYFYNTDRNASTVYQPFEAYLDEIGYNGVDVTLTEKQFIEFLAKDLRTHNPKKYTNLMTNNSILAENFTTDKEELVVKQMLYKDSQGTYYYERNKTLEDGSIVKEYVSTHILLNKPFNPDTDRILDSNEGLIVFNKTGNIFRHDNKLWVQVLTEDTTVYLALNHQNIEIQPLTGATRITVAGPVYQSQEGVYEYFEPGLLHNGVRLQFQSTPFLVHFREAIRLTYNQPWNTYNSADFTKLVLKVYFETEPEIKADFEAGFNHTFYDKAGIFVRGYWGVMTLGVTHKVNYTRYLSLLDSMVGRSTDQQYLGSTVQVAESIPLQGHVSTMILLEGLIGVILSLFFFIFMIWGIIDAYRTSEKKRLEKEVLNTKAYFKSIYENGFEYIVLSPALFVLMFISIMPIIFGFVIAFTSIQGNQSMIDTFSWVGLKNFAQIFNFTSGLGASFGQAFWRVLGWTLVWAVLSTVTVFFGGFIQALILNSEKVVFRKLWRTILILPWAIPALLSQMVFSVMFNENGFINQLLADIGIENILRQLNMIGVDFSQLTGFARYLYLGAERVQWFNNPFNPTFVRAMLIIVNIWLGFPYYMALMTGVMTAIDKSLYEAADIDGATGFQKIRQITMPLVLQSTAPLLIMAFSGNFNNFGIIYFITGGGPNAGYPANGYAGDTDILISWMYKLTVDYSTYNMASVFSVLIFLLVGSITAWNLSRTKAFQED